MSASSSSSRNGQAKKHPAAKLEGSSKPRYSWRALILFPAWVVLSYVLANCVVVAGLWIFDFARGEDTLPLNAAVFQTIVSSLIYILTLVIVTGVPYGIKKYKVTLEEMGLTRLPSWADIGLAPMALIAYLLVSAALAWLVTVLLPNLPVDTVQDVGFKALSRQYEYTLAFLTLVVIAPIAEELLFRGYLQGKLQKHVPLIPAVLVTSIVFAAAHLPGSDGVQWNVAIDVFALSIMMCFLRVITGSVWAGILLHMLKNGIAFFLTFVGPLLMLGV